MCDIDRHMAISLRAYCLNYLLVMAMSSQLLSNQPLQYNIHKAAKYMYVIYFETLKSVNDLFK